MGRRPSPFGSFKNISQIRITGTVEEIAAAHEINRQSVVKEIFVHTFLMAKFKIISGNMLARAAQRQYITGHGTDNAAHCAPGQILIGARRLQDWITGSGKLQIEVDCLFAVTDEINVNFNKADSSIEGNGLRAAFENACNFLIKNAAFARFNRAQEFYPHIKTAFERYRTEGLQACRAAINSQRAMMQNSSGNDRLSRQERLFITEKYMSTLASASSSPETVQELYPEDLWREYRAIAP